MAMKRVLSKCFMIVLGMVMSAGTLVSATPLSVRDTLSLAGKWQLKLIQDTAHSDIHTANICFDDVIQLPASLDEAHKGRRTTEGSSTHHMMRKYSFYGKAFYGREVDIPESWAGREIVLTIERTRPTRIWIDGQPAGSNQLISSPHYYRLTNQLTPGRHFITIQVDNGPDCGLPASIASSHMWSDDTQTNWNGMLGELLLEAKSPLHISRVKVHQKPARKSIAVTLQLENPYPSAVSGVLTMHVDKAECFSGTVTLQPGTNHLVRELQPGDTPGSWDEYHPELYTLKVRFSGNAQHDERTLSLGYREFTASGKNFTINGRPVFLRGRHDACVFPLTGYAPMTKSEWLDYFSILHRYGFNHVRFHSWCPPRAAFEAADQLGFYLQPELPYWGTISDDPSDSVSTFLQREAIALLDAYGNHPSFVLFSTGNELWGSIDGMKALTTAFRAYDDRPLYTLGSNYHLGWSGQQEGEDFLVSCRVGGHNDPEFEPHVRSSFSFADAIDGGLLNARYPNTRMNLRQGASRASIPVIAHETGQFQMLPDPKEPELYTGILQARNLEIFLERYYSVHGKEKYSRYFDAAAALSLLCYKADLEMMRRTPELAGYQLLDIQDFPGQGTALVGILNSHMRSKGVISEEEFRSWNNDVVPLWLADSYTAYTGEKLSSELQISNQSNRSLENALLRWELHDSSCIKKGQLRITAPAGQLSSAHPLEISLPDSREAKHYTLKLSIEGTEYRNSYSLWAYPKKAEKPLSASNPFSPSSGIALFTQLDEHLIRHLEAGKRAILMPDSLHPYPDQTVGGLFTSDYWNYSMFKSISENANKPVSPGTMGLLINAQHPLFRRFPTQSHSNWQWWPIVRNARPLIANNFAGRLHPIVESIDNVERVHFLPTIFEIKAGKGSLLVCMSDLRNNLQYKENRQLYAALLHYVQSDEFNPTDKLSTEELQQLFTEKAPDKNIKGVKNVSYN